MGSSAICVRRESRHSAHLDRHSAQSDSRVDAGTADRCDEITGNSEVLSATCPVQTTQATTRIVQGEIGLDQQWFALSHQRRKEFGSYFSELLLRAVRQQNNLTSTE